MADGRHIENVFGHNSAADCSISVKFCVGKQFFSHNLGTGTDTHVPQDVFLAFLCSLGFCELGLFVSSPILLFIFI